MNLCVPTIPDQQWTKILENQELAEHVEAIRQLGKRVIDDVIEIGRHLTECRRIVGHGNRRDDEEAGWLRWLKHHFDYTDRHALNFMRVYELRLKSETVSDFKLPLRDFYRLAAPKAKAAADEVIARAEAGEPITSATVAEIIPMWPPQRTAEQKTAARAAMAAITEAITQSPSLDMHAAITVLIRESKRRNFWIAGLAPDVVYAKGELEAVIRRLQELNEAMAARRGKKRRVKA